MAGLAGVAPAISHILEGELGHATAFGGLYGVRPLTTNPVLSCLACCPPFSLAAQACHTWYGTHTRRTRTPGPSTPSHQPFSFKQNSRVHTNKGCPAYIQPFGIRLSSPTRSFLPLYPRRPFLSLFSHSSHNHHNRAPTPLLRFVYRSLVLIITRRYFPSVVDDLLMLQ